MATISKKNINTLVNDFIKRPQEFENYSKHCLNILKKYIWLKENVENTEIDSYDYISTVIDYYGIDNISFNFIFRQYQKEVVNQISDDKKTIIHSNIYYFNQMDEFLADMQNFINQKDYLLGEKKVHKKFSRLDFIVLKQDNEIDTEKEYTYDEIYHLVLNQQIIVLDNYLSQVNININQDNTNDIDLSSKLLVVSKCQEMLGCNSKMIDNFYSFQNKQDRKIWATICEPFCNYFRTKVIHFHTIEESYPSSNHHDIYITFNVNTDFYRTLEHLQNIIDELVKYYKKRKKIMPMEKTMENIQLEMCNLKDHYEKICINQEIIKVELYEIEKSYVKKK